MTIKYKASQSSFSDCAIHTIAIDKLSKDRADTHYSFIEIHGRDKAERGALRDKIIAMLESDNE